MNKEPCTKICGVYICLLEVMKTQYVKLEVYDVIPANVQNVSRSVTPGFFACICWFYGARTYIVLWCFWPFLQTSQVRKFWMSKLFLNASDVEDFVYEHIWDEKKAF